MLAPMIQFNKPEAADKGLAVVDAHVAAASWFSGGSSYGLEISRPLSAGLWQLLYGG